MVLQPFGLPIREVKSIGLLIGPKKGGIFCCTLTTTSGWQQTVVVSEVKLSKRIERGAESAKHTWARDELKPEQGVIMTCVIRALWFCPCVF